MRWGTIQRKMILAVANMRMVRSLVERYGMKLGARRFVAAETLEETVVKVWELNRCGLLVTLDFLGEGVTDREQADQAAEAVIQILREIDRLKLKSTVSVKLSQLGMAVGRECCLENMHRIMDTAEQFGNFVRIDMEDSSLTQPTIELFTELQRRYGNERIGLVVQSYLYRTKQDVQELGALGANLRIVKGAYHEPPDIAFPSKREVDRQYKELVRAHLLHGCFTAIATHDVQIIESVKHFVQIHGIKRDQFEFQMLYGIAGELQQQLADEGYRVRVYTPFGKSWYAYFSRRIAERPANLWFVLRSLRRK